MRALCIITTALSVASLASGCLRASEPAAATSEIRHLVLAGQVHDPNGQPKAGIAVYIESAATAAGVTDALGAYRIALTDDDLARVYGEAPAQAAAFSLYFEEQNSQGTGNTGLRGRSAPIKWNERGDKTLPLMTLAPAAKITGKVLSLAGGREPLPAVQATVKFGRATLTTDQDGAFTLTGLPATNLTLTATAPRLAAAVLELTLTAGESRTLGAPLVLFPETGVAGVVQPLPPVDQATLNANGHPFLRSFQVIAAKTARYMRFHADAEALLEPELAPWLPIAERIDYDFPRDGGQVLFFQFADANRSVLSQVYSLTVVLDPYANSKGFVIEDGSGRVMRRDIVLNIDVPPGAHRMRIAESTAELDLKPWLPPMPVYSYLLELGDNNSLPLTGYGYRTVYLQFADALGLLGPVYKQTVILELFPPAPTPVFTLSGGAALIADRLTRLDIQVPPNAHQMRIFDDPTSLANSFNNIGAGGIFNNGNNNDLNQSDIWVPARPVAFHTFTSSGLKTVDLQFRTIDGALSPVYQQTIRVDPFPDYGVGFVINGGAPSAVSRYLDITLVPPVGAVAFKVFEIQSGINNVNNNSNSNNGNNVFNFGGSGNSNDTWITLTPHFLYEARGLGARTIFVAYKSIDGNESFAYSRSIYIESFPFGGGDFTINGGASVSLLPTLTLSIAPPPNAISMAISEGAPPSDFDQHWLAIAPTAVVVVAGTGPKTIYMRFRAADGSVGPTMQRTIFYEPFPFGTAGVTINQGEASTTEHDVTLHFYALPNMVRLRYAETPEALLLLPFQEYIDTAPHTFAGADGMRKVYVQYATVTGELSPVYFAAINLAPTP